MLSGNLTRVNLKRCTIQSQVTQSTLCLSKDIACERNKLKRWIVWQQNRCLLVWKQYFFQVCIKCGCGYNCLSSSIIFLLWSVSLGRITFNRNVRVIVNQAIYFIKREFGIMKTMQLGWSNNWMKYFLTLYQQKWYIKQVHWIVKPKNGVKLRQKNNFWWLDSVDFKAHSSGLDCLQHAIWE